MGWREAEQKRRNEDDPVLEMSTIGRLFEGSTSRNRNQEAQLYKGGVYDRSLVSEGVIDPSPPERYSSITYNVMQHIVHNLAAGFRDLGIEPGDRVGIFSSTRMEWAQVDFALQVCGAVVTTVYAGSSPEQAQYLLDDPNATAVIVENETLLERVMAVEDELDLSFIASIDELTLYDDREDITTLGKVHKRGEEISWPLKLERWLSSRDVDDLASIIYTSGTTGKPKGVELTHRQFRSNVNQIRKRLGPRPDKPDDLPVFDPSMTSVSFLPLAHVFERTAGHYLMFASGVSVAYAESADTVANDLGIVQPDLATSVPRVYERIYDSMQEQAGESPIKKRIFDWAVGIAREEARSDTHGRIHRIKHSIADRLVYSNVKEQLGGNIDMFISGGGSLSKDLAELFMGMGLPIAEGYGLTEAAPVVSVNPIEDIRPGTLGPPLTGIDVTFDDTSIDDERKRRASGKIGELLVRGPNVTEKYWNNPEATEKAFTGDWIHTGDIVEQTSDGYLIFHDRLKQILVLSTGKNVTPVPIEDAFSTSNRVEQIMVIGDNEKFVSALIVPNFDAIERWRGEKSISLPESRAAICQNDRVGEWILEDVNTINEQFEAEEQIKMFELVPEEWTPENDMLTPSMKKKRRNILEKYAGQVDRIYERAG
ncbi:AMP-dependent synthetase/ligase [Halocatena marina]|uniref:AMP-dependent synthetase/ligase n=1 Tax=Halocatena marina TaxID=2934937 RepID=UPI0035A17CAB